MFIFNLLPECRWSEVTVAESEQDKVLARGMDSQPSPSTWCKSRHTFTINQENPTQTDRKVTFPRWTFLYKSKWIVIASNTMIITTVVSHQTCQAKHDQQGIEFVEEEAAAPELKVLEARISRLQDCHPFYIWIKISFGSAMFSRIQITLTLPNVIYWYIKTASFMICFKLFWLTKPP